MLLQPDKNTCTQAVIAWVAGVSIERAIKAMGWHRDCKRADIYRACRELGVKFEYVRDFPKKGPLPRLFLAAVGRGRNTNGHLVGIRDCEVFDPEIGVLVPIIGYQNGVMFPASYRWIWMIPVLENKP